jgi:Tol biopolymer transport system component
MRWLRCAVTLAALVVLTVPGPGSADGEELIVLERGGRIVVVRSDGTGRTDLGPGSAPALSPDGTRVAFVDGGDVWVLGRATGTRVRITSAPTAERAPVWSPDGTRLAFASTPSAGDPSGLDVAAADGTTLVRVAFDVRAAYGPPTWSPDGAELAYTAVRGYSDDLGVARADGSGARRLTADDVRDIAPAWAPRGDTIAFLRATAEGLTLHLVAADGTGLRQLSRTAVSAPLERSGAAWSPDGRRIAFPDSFLLYYSRYGPIYASDIRVLDLGGGERALQSGGERPSWSADGNRILSHNFRQAPGEEEGTQVYVMNADGSCQLRVAAGSVGAQPWRGAAGPPARCADLQLSVTQDRTVVGIHQAATFGLTVTNLGNEPATGVWLDVEEPANAALTLSAPEGACSVTLRNGACSLGTISPGATSKVTAVLKVHGIGPVMTMVQVRSNEPDRNQAGNHARLGFDAISCSLVGTWADDTLVGTPARDVICTLTGRDVIHALDGSDVIDSGNGSDRVFPGPGRDFVQLKGGADFIDARDGRRDEIACGPEADIALIDRFDAVDESCDVVSKTTFRCTILGTSYANTMAGSPRSDSICTFSGGDTVDGGAGDDQIDGGTGNDTLTGGLGSDLLVGDGGNDLIKARDGQRDRIRCGSELDLVLADRRDVAGADCERVIRR